jgi:hypothetical protein
MEQAYSSVTYGMEEPNLMVTSPLGLSYVKMAFQSQQRFQSQKGNFGFTGVEFNNAIIMADRYCPGTAGGSGLALGQSSLDADGETLFFSNVKKEHMGLWLSNDDLMGFGFTGSKPAQGNLTAVGQYLFAGNFTVRNTRYHRYLHAITG